jgi:adenine-specific DNA-methyltransferase
MNFIEFASTEKLRGGYYTHSDVADFLTRWILQARPRRLLEPACGDGAFFAALARLGAVGIESIVGCEIFAGEAEKARTRARAVRGAAVEVFAEDFLQWALARLNSGVSFDAVIGNPPFIRYQYLNSHLQTLAEQLFRILGLAFTKHTNAWVPFVLASLALLRPGGRLAMIVPSELLHILYARSLRSFLRRQCARILVLDPHHLWFEKTLQGVVLLMAQKRDEGDNSESQLALVPVKDRSALARAPEDYFRRADFFPTSLLNGKWMLGLLSLEERTLLERLSSHPAIRPFRERASVDVGIVTGANKFFLVPQAVVREHSLGAWAHPMFGRSEHVGGAIYDKRCHRQNQQHGLPTNFLWFGDRSLSELPASARHYIRAGEEQGLHQRYKCRIRSPWYNVPSVYAAPVAMLKRAHHFPRLILNTAKAFTTDTAYRIILQKGRALDLVAGFVNSLTALSAELEGRHYGGGVLEMVPSEIERLLVPVIRASATALRRLDAALKSRVAAEELLAQQDRWVLGPLGIDEKECDTLHRAWRRLRRRRQRT